MDAQIEAEIEADMADEEAATAAAKDPPCIRTLMRLWRPCMPLKGSDENEDSNEA